jgi:hypothetical protein
MDLRERVAKSVYVDLLREAIGLSAKRPPGT